MSLETNYIPYLVLIAFVSIYFVINAALSVYLFSGARRGIKVCLVVTGLSGIPFPIVYGIIVHVSKDCARCSTRVHPAYGNDDDRGGGGGGGGGVKKGPPPPQVVAVVGSMSGV
nr:hypothetical protein BaRGS_024887 [Batillaria attramentaria]